MKGSKNSNYLKQIELKENMIAALSHEIRNPLNTIKGANKYLNEKFKDIKEINEFTEIINNEILRIERYLNEFISFSRGIKLKLKTVDPVQYIKGIVLLAKYSFNGKIYIIEKKQKLPDITIDVELMRQVLDNLILNAKEAVNEIKNPEIKIILNCDNKFFYIEVVDNGIGISKENLKKVFYPFFTTKPNGLGIGLSICKAIISRHGGNIYLKSNKRAGTTFTIKIPILKGN
jgi:signal transduction histidine kinase